MFDYDEEDRPIMDDRWGGEDDWKEQKRRERQYLAAQRQYLAAQRRAQNAGRFLSTRGRPKSSG